MKKIKFSDEQLSLILTAHACGGLITGGSPKRLAYPACIVQVAEQAGYLSDIETEFCNVWHVAAWFDNNYSPKWIEEDFLEELETAGLTMTKIKFTDEQVSAILTAHANGGLKIGGASFMDDGTPYYAYPACLLQVAYEADGFGCEMEDQFSDLWKVAYWFDDTYKPDWTEERLVAALAGKGLI